MSTRRGGGVRGGGGPCLFTQDLIDSPEGRRLCRVSRKPKFNLWRREKREVVRGGEKGTNASGRGCGESMRGGGNANVI